jgi:hypothetical protein
VREYVEIAETIGPRVGLVPRHHEHAPTLLSCARDALYKRKPALFLASVAALLKLGGLRGIIFSIRSWATKPKRARETT